MAEKKRKEVVKVAVRFWTAGLPEGEKVALEHGTLTLAKDAGRGIKTAQMQFKDLDDVMPKLRKLLEINGVRLVKSKGDAVDIDRLIEE